MSINDIDLDVMNAIKQLKEGEGIVYFRIKEDHITCLMEGDKGFLSFGFYTFIEQMNMSEHEEIICSIEAGCDRVRIDSQENYVYE